MFRVKYISNNDVVQEDFDQVNSYGKDSVHFTTKVDDEGKANTLFIPWDCIVSIEQIEKVSDVLERIKPGTVFQYEYSNNKHKKWTAIKAEDGKFYDAKPDHEIDCPQHITQVFVPVSKLNHK